MLRQFYQRIIKRILDVIGVIFFAALFWWLVVLTAILVRAKLGKPVLFRQKRPGMVRGGSRQERIFTLYKFRTMTDARDEAGALLPDADRLTPFGRFLRSTSLDELPEMWNVLKGEMSFVGPRPLLVRDMVFMTPEQRKRHTVKPGLTGLAQVNGRNCISWAKKLDYDLEYVQSCGFLTDLRIALKTVKKVLTREGINRSGMATDEDLGDHLLRLGEISKRDYERGQAAAEQILEGECNEIWQTV